MLEKTEGAVKKLTIQKHWRFWAYKTKDEDDQKKAEKHNRTQNTKLMTTMDPTKKKTNKQTNKPKKNGDKPRCLRMVSNSCFL